MINPRQTMWRFLAAVSICVACFALSSAAGAQTLVDPGDLGPDVAIVVSPVTTEDAGALIPALGRIDSVVRATVDTPADGSAVFYLAVAEPRGLVRPIDAVVAEARQLISDRLPEAEILVGGEAVVDQALSDRFGRGVAAVTVVALLAAALLGVVFGWRRGVLCGVALGAAVVCGGAFGSQIGGDFNGTYAATSVVGALAALIGAVAVTVRLLLWFRQPSGTDGAETLRRAITEIAPEIALVVVGLIVAAVSVELLNSGPSPLSTVTAAAVVSIALTVAIVAPGLTLLQGSPERDASMLPLALPDGRDFPLIVLSATVLVLLALSLFAFRPLERTLLDHDRLPSDEGPAVVAERLAVGGGDATGALVAINNDTATQAEFEGWAGVIVERDEVERVDLGSGRLLATGPAEVDDNTLLVPPGQDGVAVIVLTVPPRSAAGQGVTGGLAAIPLAGGAPEFEGTAATAAGVAGSARTLVIAIVILAAVAGIAVRVLTQDMTQAVMVFILRLVIGAASLGVFRLVVGDATMAQSMVVISLLALGAGLFELEFLRQLDAGVEPSGIIAAFDQDQQTTTRRSSWRGYLANGGQSAALGLAALGLAGLAVACSAMVGGGPGTGLFGLGLMSAAGTEILIGVLLLRPALLGQRAAFHTAARPVRIAIHTGAERQRELGAAAEDPAWRRVLTDLLHAEFRFQSDPTVADLESVFVPDTPLYKQAASHHANLAGAGLHIVGRSPVLRSLKTVSGRSPVSLAVTVDHPARNLVDAQGTVVGVRKPERRSGVLWLSVATDGSYRIAESVELGSVSLSDELSEQIGGDIESPGDVDDSGEYDDAGGFDDDFEAEADTGEHFEANQLSP